MTRSHSAYAVSRLWRVLVSGLLRLYPGRFRAAYATRIMEAFRADLARARSVGWLAVTRLALRISWDLSRNAVLERRDERRRRRRNPPRRVQMFDILRDCRIGLRSLRRAPGFTIITVGIITLGVGANTTIFTIVNRLFLDDPPGVVEPDRLVRITRATPYTQSGSLAFPDYEHYRENASVFSGLAGYDDANIALSVRAGDHVVSGSAWPVSANYFSVLGLTPALGRFFRPDEDVVGAPRSVAVLRHGFWQRALGGDSAIVGSTVDFNGHPFVVVGIASSEFRGLTPAEQLPDVWIPITAMVTVQPGSEGMFERVPGNVNVWVSVVGRLAPGVSVSTAQAGMDVQANYLMREFPEWNADWGIHLSEDYRYRPANRAALVQMAGILTLAALAVLIVAAANLAILMLARGTSRAREMGVRIALGAGRGRIATQLSAEVSLLTVAGGTLGFFMAVWASNVLGWVVPFPGMDISPDGRVLMFALVTSAVAALLFGVAPAVQASRTAPQIAIKDGQRTSMGGSRLQNTLVIGQLAVSIVLVTGSLLFARSLRIAQATDVGFETEGRMYATFRLGNLGYDVPRARLFVLESLDRVAALPGVRAATVSSQLPFRGQWTGGVFGEGAATTEGEDYFDIGLNAVGPGYLETVGIPLVRGRDISSSDAGGESGVVLNEAAAEALWPGQDALGRALWRGSGDRRVTFRVVGIARNATYYELGEPPQPQLYLPVLHSGVAQYAITGRINVLVDVAGDPLAVAPSVTQSLREIDTRIAFSGVGLLREVVDRQFGQYRVSATLVGVFAVIALSLAVLGLYGVLSYLVARRAHEIGIRVALGASQWRVASGVVRRAIVMTGVGVVLGVAGALALSGLVANQLFGIAPTDPVTYATVPLVLLGAAVLAAAVPARRAARVDPLRAMRVE